MGPPLNILLLFGVCIINIVIAIPANYGPADTSIYKVEHCLKMSPAREEEINSIVVRLSDYLYNLTLEYDELDIRLVKLVVESHSENEVEEKDTQVQLLVNDCAYTDDVHDGKAHIESDGDSKPETADKTIAIPFDDEEPIDGVQGPSVVEKKSVVQQSRVIATKNESKVVEKTAESDSGVVNSVSKTEVRNSTVVDENEDDLENSILIVDSTDEDSENVEDNLPGKRPEVLLLDLDDAGKELVELYEEKHGKTPLLVYVRKVFDDLQYWFVN